MKSDFDIIELFIGEREKELENGYIMKLSLKVVLLLFLVFKVTVFS